MAENKDSDLQKIKELIEIMKRNELVEVEISHGDDKIFLKRSQPQPSTGGGGVAVPMGGTGVSGIPSAAHVSQYSAPQVPPSFSEAQLEDDLVEIKSPLVGTFYANPSPDSNPYVEVGSHVGEQEVVCIVEAMKVMNEIKSEISGTIAEILVVNGQAIEYGQVLFKIRPD
jgi:acetyl-CoA carboxylase biotin carboxyl carrier protein